MMDILDSDSKMMVQIPSLLLISCVTMSKLISHEVSQFPYL
jgi:hypothetical protein